MVALQLLRYSLRASAVSGLYCKMHTHIYSYVWTRISGKRRRTSVLLRSIEGAAEWLHQVCSSNSGINHIRSPSCQLLRSVREIICIHRRECGEFIAQAWKIYNRKNVLAISKIYTAFNSFFKHENVSILWNKMRLLSRKCYSKHYSICRARLSLSVEKRKNNETTVGIHCIQIMITEPTSRRR